jgi:hypothetical protein
MASHRLQVRYTVELMARVLPGVKDDGEYTPALDRKTSRAEGVVVSL